MPPPAVPTTTTATTTPSASNGSTTAPTDGSVAQPPDLQQGGANQEYLYTQWAEYYRAYGMFKEAEMIEQMAKNSKSVLNVLVY